MQGRHASGDMPEGDRIATSQRRNRLPHSIGTVDANLIHPREVFRPALECGAVALLLAHNHPSGVLKASKMDIEVTKQIVECGKIMGIDVLDHIIITKDGFISIDVEYN